MIYAAAAVQTALKAKILRNCDAPGSVFLPLLRDGDLAPEGLRGMRPRLRPHRVQTEMAQNQVLRPRLGRDLTGHAGRQMAVAVGGLRIRLQVGGLADEDVCPAATSRSEGRDTGRSLYAPGVLPRLGIALGSVVPPAGFEPALNRF